MQQVSLPISWLLIVIVQLLLSTPWSIHAADIDFGRQVRPILSDKCYACHGPDAEQRQANLRFDTREGAFIDLGGYAAIVSGKPGESELIRRIESADQDDAMPPADHPKQLSEAEKRTLSQWIQQGAVWQDHWAYVPPVRHQPPPTNNDQWTDGFIDAFILASLEKHGVAPSEEADRRILLRRLSFDLTGLPPTPQEIAELVSDPSDAAYEAAVDRLLASPHFGERMAMYWLDLVRYADTVGYHGDQDVSVSPFRDYVINAFNTNLRFDRFTREQLAGDLLDNPTRDQLIASGYNKLGMMSAEGGVQPEEYLAKYASDRVRTASTVWMGSTLGCAECHDHKFDPFTTKDFYQFAAFFSDIKERGLYSGAGSSGNWGPTVEVPDRELADLLIPADEKISRLTRILNTPTDQLAQSQRQWEVAQIELLDRWQTAEPTSAIALHGTKLDILEDNSILASGNSPDQNTYTVSVRSASAKVTGVRIEVLPDASLPSGGPGRAGNGNLVLTELRMNVHRGGAVVPVDLKAAQATREQEAGGNNPYGKWSAESAIDGDVQGASWGWAILPDAGKANALVIALAEPIEVDSALYELTIEQNHTNPRHTLGSFRIATTSADDVMQSINDDPLPENIQHLLAVAREDRSEEQANILADYYRSIAPQLKETREQLATAQKERQELIASRTRTSLITVAVEPREVRVLKRGNWMDKSGELVQPGVPHFLAQLDSRERGTRLDLANWIVAKDNPLTARVFVNRLWKLFFGSGLSKLLDDVGSQGEPPVHPELLDSLAVEFVDSGWNIKHMVKLMVMSNTYRQSSLMREPLRELDPYNRLLARQSRFRLDAEMVRDNALAISGLLVPEVGGRSVKPYQPVGLYRHLNFPKRQYRHDTGPNQYRRGVYTHWQRQFLHPAMQAFDAPAREECTAERPRSNTPLAALVLLNDPSYVEAARRFAELAILSGGDDSVARLNWMMNRALSRDMASTEQAIFQSLLDSHLTEYAKQPEEAKKLIAAGLSQPAEQIEPAELAAWTSVARTLLNMHETVTRN